MSENDQQRLHVCIDGRVQGVGFRYFTKQQAAYIAVTGWIRNRWDGTVEVVAEGEKRALDEFLKVLRRGPRAAMVQDVQTDWDEATGEFTSFQVRSTA